MLCRIRPLNASESDAGDVTTPEGEALALREPGQWPKPPPQLPLPLPPHSSGSSQPANEQAGDPPPVTPVDGSVERSSQPHQGLRLCSPSGSATVELVASEDADHHSQARFKSQPPPSSARHRSNRQKPRQAWDFDSVFMPESGNLQVYAEVSE